MSKMMSLFLQRRIKLRKKRLYACILSGSPGEGVVKSALYFVIKRYFGHICHKVLKAMEFSDNILLCRNVFNLFRSKHHPATQILREAPPNIGTIITVISPSIRLMNANNNWTNKQNEISSFVCKHSYLRFSTHYTDRLHCRWMLTWLQAVASPAPKKCEPYFFAGEQ